MIPAVVSAVSDSCLLPSSLKYRPQCVHRQGGMSSQGNFRVSVRSVLSGSSAKHLLCGWEGMSKVYLLSEAPVTIYVYTVE